jgi:hypothetical protein
MPTEVEELRLVITLTDNASAGIAALRAQFAQLGSGATAGNVERFKRGHNELAKQIKELSELTVSGEKAMLSFIGKFGIAGAAVAGFGLILTEGIKGLNEFSAKITDLNNRARVMGVHPAVLKNIEEQLDRIGVTADITDANVSRFNEAYAKMGIRGSKEHLALVQSAGRFNNEMEASIQSVLAQRTQASRMNEALAQSQTVFNERMKDTNNNITDATEFTKKFLAAWGIDPTFALIKHLQETSQEEIERMDQRTKATAEWHKGVKDLKHEWEDWMDEIKTSALSPDGILVQGLQLAITLTKTLHELWNQPITGKVAGAAADVGSLALNPQMIPVRIAKELYDRLHAKPPVQDQTGKSMADQLGAGNLPPAEGAEGRASHLMSSMSDDAETHTDTMKDNTGQLKRLNDYLAAQQLGVGGGGVGSGAGGGGGGGAQASSNARVASADASDGTKRAVGDTSSPSSDGRGNQPSVGPSMSGGGGDIFGGGRGLSGGTAPITVPGGGGDKFTPGKTFPGTYPTESELSDKSRAAGERFNNPFNMWYDRYAKGQGGLPGKQITQFDTPSVFPSKQAGAAAAIRKMANSPLYSGKTMQDLIGTWVGHGESYAPIIEGMTGISRNTKITPEFLASEDGLKFLKAMSRYETKSSEPYHLTDEQWREARTSALAKTSSDEARNMVDRRSVKTVKVDATGKVAVNIGGGSGSDATLGSERLFKPTSPERSTQMQPASTGPRAIEAD